MKKVKFLRELKILFVEDEINISTLLNEAISDYFHTFSIAYDGEEGFEKFKKLTPDIVITDIMMPKIDGLEMAEKIKAIDENIPVIVLSAFSDKQKLLKAIDLGITKYFIKPFDPQELLDYLTFLAQKLDKQRLVCLDKHFSFDNITKTLYKDDLFIHTTKKEKQFIALLVEYRGEIVTHQMIKEQLWNDQTINDERLRTFVKRIRAKTSKTLIKNIIGQGYSISPDDI
ncbi:MAG: response regulator transcription factor [Epsilonproteobacteria bacterium]|nr:response regulator transcription factor [Campylobacterota bacterium]